jgi:hypothetical protein
MASKVNIKDLFDVLIYILFAAVIIPIIAGQVVTLEGDTTNFSATEILVLGLITTFLVLGIVYAIVKKML